MHRAPSELDQMAVFIDEVELGMAETTLEQLRGLARGLPFESAMLNLALLNLRVEPVLNDPDGQWELACWFYASWPDLLARYQRVRMSSQGRPIFSPQPIALLMRVLLDEAREEPLRELTEGEFHTLQSAVLGAHSAIESSLERLPLPSREAVLAYELQASTFFNRPPLLEEMARSQELLRLMRSDEVAWGNRVPVGEWLAAMGMTIEEQWKLGFGLSATTNAFGLPALPRIGHEHLEQLLTKLGFQHTPSSVPVIAASRAELQERFEALGGGAAALAWEVRPFKRSPFLRLLSGDLLLLGLPWLLSWLGEGFHYRAMTHAQQVRGKAELLRYTRFMGEVVERYALDLARAAMDSRAVVMGEQRYGKGGGQRTSDVAIVRGSDLILFEVHARRVTATAAATGDVAEALREVSKLLVVKVDQVGGCIAALLAGTATLPGADIEAVERIWPVVVSVGHLMQTRNVWSYIRNKIEPATARTLAADKVQPLQLLDISDYEKLLGLVEAGGDLPAMLARKAAGAFRERDLAAWLHGDLAAPSDQPRLSALESRWEEMAVQVTRTNELAMETKVSQPEEASPGT